MRKLYLLLFGAVAVGYVAQAQMDSSPLKGKTLGTATRYAGGVDKEKIMDLFQDQQYDDALGYLSPVLQADSDNLPVLNYAGYAYYMSDKEGAAIACFRRMLRLDSNSITGLHYLVLLQENNDVADALQYALQLVQLQPTKAAWWRSVGELLAREKMPDSAIGCLWKALGHAISKTAEWYYDDLGDNYELQKQYRRAVAHYDTAYYLFREPLALYTCGRICESELHDMARARGYYRRYLAVARPVSEEEKKVWRYVRKRWAR